MKIQTPVSKNEKKNENETWMMKLNRKFALIFPRTDIIFN